MIWFNRFNYIIKRNLKKLILFITFVITLQMVTTILILNLYVEHISDQIFKNTVRVSQGDTISLCNSIDCKYVIDGSDISEDIFQPYQQIILHNNNMYLTNNFEIGVRDTLSNKIFVLNTHNIIQNIITYSIMIFTLTVTAFTMFLFWSIKQEQEDAIITLAGNEALLTNKSMILITENIHHELNTPLEVIDNKVHKIKKIIDYYLAESSNINKNDHCRKFDDHLENIVEDFSLIKQSSEQIYNILDRMKGFKHIRYSNGNKTLSDIIKGAFTVISISNSNFKSQIDPELKEYSIKSNEFKNADLLNIMINHIKNSLEANANKIYITFDKFEKGFIYFRINDNGNGVRAENINTIFEPNFSTKTSIEGVRGNGLYLNKTILKSGNGDIKLIETSEYGTTFQLKVPAKLKGSN